MIHPGRILVIGGSAAGAAAAAKAKRVSPVTEVILFEKSSYISTGVCEIPYVLSGDIKSYQDIVFYDADKFFNEKGVKVLTDHFVESIDRQKKNIKVSNLISGDINNYSYDKLIVATGSSSVILPQFDPLLNNVFYIKTVADLIKLLKYRDRNVIKSAAVIGASYLGLEMVEALKSFCNETALFEKSHKPLPAAEKEIQILIGDELKRKQVDFYSHSDQLTSFADNNAIKSIKLDGRILEYDVYIITAGVKPETNLFSKAKLEIGKSGAVRVDNKFCTSDSNIYAAGDCAESNNLVTRKPEFLPLAALARDHGHIAGSNAAGQIIRSNPVVKNISVKIFDYYHTAVGLSSSEAEAYRINVKSVDASVPNLVPVMPASAKVYGKVLFSTDNKKILGASFFGGREVSGYADIISGLIAANQNVEVLAKINYNYTPPLSPFKNLLSVLGRKIFN